MAKKECVICQAHKTGSKGTGYETLTKCVTTSAAEALLSLANKRENEYTSFELTGLTASNIIAKEYHYHRSCYKNITRKQKEKMDTEEQESNARSRSFDSLTTFMRDHIVVEHGEVLKLNQLTTLYEDYQRREVN